MTGLVNVTLETYSGLFENADPRVKNWCMMNSLMPTVLVLSLYLCIVKYAPRVMKDRQPVDIKYGLVGYNLCMVFLSGYIFFEMLTQQWLNGHSLIGCQGVDYSNSENAIRIARVSWLFLITKYIELTDTVFFILKKKFSHITFLHVVHHGCLPLFWWFGVKFAAGGFGTFHAMVNAFVHMVMYTYYGLSAIGPSMQKYLWWKKYMTNLQIIQFIIAIIHTSQIFFIKCDFPMVFAVIIFVNNWVFLILFLNFYITTYTLSKPRINKDKSHINANRITNYQSLNANNNNGFHKKTQ